MLLLCPLCVQLTQQKSIDHFFSNLTWNKIEELERLNEDSFDFELATHWRNPSIYLTLSLFFITKVSALYQVGPLAKYLAVQACM